MGVPEETPATHPATIPTAMTEDVSPIHTTTNTLPTHDNNAIAPVPAHLDTLPPAYEKSAAAAQPGVPRNDDPAKAEIAPNAVPQTMMVTPLNALGQVGANIDCPFCHEHTTTKVNKTESDQTWIYTLLCCICCGCIGAIFPLLLGWGNDFDHYCTRCGNRVARVPHEGGSMAVQVFGPQGATTIPSQHPGAPQPVQLQQQPQQQYHANVAQTMSQGQQQQTIGTVPAKLQ